MAGAYACNFGVSPAVGLFFVRVGHQVAPLARIGGCRDAAYFASAGRCARLQREVDEFSVNSEN